jgi:CheY-like chemotaxis protein
MGLSVVYGIVKRHGGEIDVTSTPQQGSVFTITLPINLTVEQEKTKIEAPVTGVHDANILVVDDDDEVRTLLYEIISKAGYNVDIAGSGEEGIASVQQKSYDMVITDLGMPNVTGRDVAKAVRKATPNVPVVLITGWGVQIDAVEEGVDGVIAKPFDRQEILTQIAKMLKSRVPNNSR